LVLCAATLAQEPNSPAAGKGSSVDLVIAGEVAGFRQAPDLINPQGGLGSEHGQGLLGLLQKVEGKPLRILAGNNVGTELRSVNRVRRDLPSGKSDNRVTLLAPVPPERPAVLTNAYKEKGVDFAACNEEFGAVDNEAATERCLENLLLWDLEKAFDVIAIGEGDFNFFRTNHHFNELRYAPFVSSNLFLYNDDKPKKHARNSVFRWLIEPQVFPNAPLEFELLDGSPDFEFQLLGDLPSGGKWPTIHFQRKSGKDSLEVRFSECAREFIVSYDAAAAVVVDGSKVTFTPPVPLLPSSTYELTVTQAGVSAGGPFATLETYTRPGDRPKKRASATDKLAPLLYSTGSPGDWRGHWVDGLPIVAFQEQPQLLIVSLIDDGAAGRIDRPAQGSNSGSSAAPRIKNLRFLPMEGAVDYWRSVIGWRQFKKNLVAFGAALMKFQTNTTSEIEPGLLAILKETNDLTGSNALDQTEKRSWTDLNQWAAGCAKQGACPAAPVRFGTGFLEASLKAIDKRPLLIALAQTNPDRIHTLAARRPDVGVWIGKATEDVQTSGIVRDGVSGSIRVFPKTLARAVDKLKLTIRSESPARITDVGHERQVVPGEQLKLLWKESDAGRPADQCCDKDTMEFLDRMVPGRKPTLLSQKAVGEGLEHLYKTALKEMLETTHAEAALLPDGFLDTNVVDAVFGLAYLALPAGKKPVDLSSTTIDELAGVPGIGLEKARQVLAQQIKSRAELTKVLGPSEFEWAQWFVRGPGDADLGSPFVDGEQIRRELLARLLPYKDDVLKVVLPADGLAALLKDLKPLKPVHLGLGAPGTEKLHREEIKGSLPVTLAVPSRIGEKGSPYKSLQAATVVRDRDFEGGSIASRIRQRVTDRRLQSLQDRFNDLDKKPWYLLSVERFNFEFSEVRVPKDFKTISSESRTQSKAQQQISANPRLVFSRFGRHLDWVFSGETKLSRNRISDGKSIQNSVDDTGKLAGEGRYKLFGKQAGVFAGTAFSAQLYTPTTEIKLIDYAASAIGDTKKFDAPLAFDTARQREIAYESGVFVQSVDRKNYVRFGYTYGTDLNRLKSVRLDADGVSLTLIPSETEKRLNELNLARFGGSLAPLFSAGRIYPQLERTHAIQTGLTFGYKFGKPLGSWASGSRELSFESSLSEGNWFASRRNDSSLQTRLRMLLDNKIKVPIWGNLTASVGVETFIFRNKAGNENADVKTFWRLRPSLSIDFPIDFKPHFMRIYDAFAFRKAK